MIEFLSDPSIWLGLVTLVVLEVILGIDNLIFIAILADKLPPKERDRARQIGLSLALVMRLILLASISWLMGLTSTLFSIRDMDFSTRDLILILGGMFLLFKATMELHDRLEGHSSHQGKPKAYAVFWVVIAQIVALDAVFSIDSVITAIGMSDHLSVMMAAVIIAMLVMMLASKPLTAFVNAHPTVVMLCLGFLLMVGFSLVAEGFHVHIPKGYLYAAIGFSVIIEAFNQMVLHKQRKKFKNMSLRERTADAVLRMLGGNRLSTESEDTAEAPVLVVAGDPLMDLPEESLNVFSDIEREMMRGVLRLGERSVRSIMTPRPDIRWLDINAPLAETRQIIVETGYSQYLLCDGEIDKVLGIIRTKDIVAHASDLETPDMRKFLNASLNMPESVSVLVLLEKFRDEPIKCALILDEYGTVEGIVTLTDIMSAIAGEFGRGDDDDIYEPERDADGSWILDGAMDIHNVEETLGTDDLVDENEDYVTLAGFILWTMKKLPHAGEFVDYNGWRFTVLSLDGRRIADVQAQRLPNDQTED